MKTRNGFVSNSSSSSFLTSAAPDAEPYIEVAIKYSIKQNCEEKIGSLRDLENYLDDTYGSWYEEGRERARRTITAELEKGNVVYVCVVSNSDEPTAAFIHDHMTYKNSEDVVPGTMVDGMQIFV